MIGFLIYCDTEGNDISPLCGKNFNLANASYFVPCIGETFIDKNREIEYVVEDVIRSVSEEEYGVQVLLRKRKERKYK